MDLNSKANRDSLIKVFPKLDTDPNFKISSPCSQIYNCIAWAMQYEDRWVDILDTLPGHWWPGGVEKDMKSETLVQAFEAEGFIRAENHIPEDGFDKVVLYKKENADEWTHAARIVSQTKEHSKFGQAWDGYHSDNSLESQSYGKPFAYMKREQTYSTSKGQLTGSIKTDSGLLQKLMKKFS